MASWSDVESEAPELAAAARRFLDANGHKVLGTLRADGSPRLTGSEAYFIDGDLWWGSMWMALKARDLRRDPRFSLHSSSADPSVWEGDARVSGRAVEMTDDPEAFAKVMSGGPPGRAHVFRADVTEVSVVRLNEARSKLVIEVWKPGEPVRRVER